jgi:hypothetical protein
MYLRDFSLNPSRLRYALERDGEMSKLRAMTGLRVSSSPSTSTYIIEKKIRNIVNHFAKDKGFQEQKKCDRMITKLDRLATIDLVYLHHLGTEESVSEMIAILRLPYHRIHKLAEQWHSQKQTSEEESFNYRSDSDL